MTLVPLQIKVEAQEKRKLKQLALDQDTTVSNLLRACIAAMLLEVESRSEL